VIPILRRDLTLVGAIRTARFKETLVPAVFSAGFVAVFLWAVQDEMGVMDAVVLVVISAFMLLGLSRYIWMVATNLGRRTLLSAERHEGWVVVARGRGKVGGIVIPTGETLWFERVTRRSAISGQPGDLGIGLGGDFIVIRPPGGITKREIDTITASLEEMGIRFEKAPHGLGAMYDQAIEEQDLADETESKRWVEDTWSAQNPASTLEHGMYRVLGPTPSSRASVFLVGRALVIMAGTASCFVLVFLARPSFSNWNPMIILWSMLMCFVGYLASVTVFGLSRRVVVSLGTVGTLYIRVSEQRTRLVSGGWPCWRQSIPLENDTAIEVFHHSTQIGSWGDDPRPGEVNGWYLQRTDEGCTTEKGRIPSISFKTYYCPDESSLAALRSALRAHGVKMKYRSRPPE